MMSDYRTNNRRLKASTGVSFWVAVAAGLVSGCADTPAEPPRFPLAAPRFAIQVTDTAALQRMQEYVDTRYPKQSVRHTFTLPSGMGIDCVELRAQPGLLRAGMQSHVIAVPPAPLTASLTAPQNAEDEAFLKEGNRNAQGEELSCPPGTIPIRRTTIEDVMRFRSVADLMQKYPRDRDGNDPREVMGLLGPSSLHQYAHAAQYARPNVGAHTIINVWSPVVHDPHEFSLGQLWVVAGGGSNLQTLEAGVQKFPNLYGDWSPHLFIYSTSDGYGPAGCYNLMCSRFVQVDRSVVIAGSVSSVSSVGGPQHELEFTWVLHDGNWWLGVQNVWVGYYPGSLYNAAGLARGATAIDFGGEIIDDRSWHTGHTKTAMGSGAFPATGFGNAAYQRAIFYYTDPATTHWATGISTSRSSAYCYDITKRDNDPTWGTYLFYGGPGHNVNCE